jgi:hypothetical protein
MQCLGYSFRTLIAAPNQCPNSPMDMYVGPPGLSDDMVNAFLMVEWEWKPDGMWLASLTKSREEIIEDGAE